MAVWLTGRGGSLSGGWSFHQAISSAHTPGESASAFNVKKYQIQVFNQTATVLITKLCSKNVKHFQGLYTEIKYFPNVENTLLKLKCFQGFWAFIRTLKLVQIKSKCKNKEKILPVSKHLEKAVVLHSASLLVNKLYTQSCDGVYLWF